MAGLNYGYSYRNTQKKEVGIFKFHDKWIVRVYKIINPRTKTTVVSTIASKKTEEEAQELYDKHKNDYLKQ